MKQVVEVPYDPDEPAEVMQGRIQNVLGLLRNYGISGQTANQREGSVEPIRILIEREVRGEKRNELTTKLCRLGVKVT